MSWRVFLKVDQKVDLKGKTHKGAESNLPYRLLYSMFCRLWATVRNNKGLFQRMPYTFPQIALLIFYGT